MSKRSRRGKQARESQEFTHSGLGRYLKDKGPEIAGVVMMGVTAFFAPSPAPSVTIIVPPTEAPADLPAPVPELVPPGQMDHVLAGMRKHVKSYLDIVALKDDDPERLKRSALFEAEWTDWTSSLSPKESRRVFHGLEEIHQLIVQPDAHSGSLQVNTKKR